MFYITIGFDHIVLLGPMYAFRLIFVLSVCCCYGVSINDDDDDDRLTPKVRILQAHSMAAFFVCAGREDKTFLVM